MVQGIPEPLNCKKKNTEMTKHILKIYPLGNADTTLFSLANGKQILWDYANKKDKNDNDDKRCDLPEELDKDTSGDFDVVCFTHADEDHYKGFSEYFYLTHDSKYQDNKRRKIKELWVPAALLLETGFDNEEAKTLQKEARYRLKNKSGILVFSRPKKMKEWCDRQNDISFDDVKHLFIDAGTIVPTFNLENDGVEFFVHSPFYSESQNIDRNKASIVVQVTFNDKCQSKVIMGGDCTHEVWKDIITITSHFGRQERLEWDIFHISHHCSYLSLDAEKGEDITDPEEDIKWLYEEKGNNRSRLISPSWPIPKKGAEDDNNQPPHRQAASYYKNVANKLNGEFLVTMETPSKEEPKKIIFEIDIQTCIKLQKASAVASVNIADKKIPRAGRNYELH